MNNENEFIHIGSRELWGGGMSDVGVWTQDAGYHTYIVGKTGSGKSTLLRNLILQHIRLGHGVGVIDPHGDLSDSLLDHIPPSRADHLCYFNPGDTDHPVAFNLLANSSEDERHLLASGIVGAFKNIWPESWGPRMAYIFHNAVLALTECPNATLLGVNRMLTDDAYRRWVIKQVRDPFIKDFWENEYESYDARFRREAIAPIQNKMGAFMQSPILRNVLGQVRTKLSIPFIMDEGRLFIANLSKGKLGHDKAGLLGSLLVSQFHLAAMQRNSIPEAERRPFYLFVDEFQNFMTDAFSSMLSEARKYRLGLTLAHQFTEQLSDTIRSSIFGNVGTIISFRVGFDDAEILRNEFGREFEAHQFVSLGQHETFLRLHHQGAPQLPFRARTHPPLEFRHERRQKLIARSRQRFSRPRAQVEDRLRRWLEGSAFG